MKERLLGRADEALIEIAGHEPPYSFNVPQHPEAHVRRAVRVLHGCRAQPELGAHPTRGLQFPTFSPPGVLEPSGGRFVKYGEVTVK
jgi:hypothetical protein